MPKRIGTANHTRYAHELALSIYFPLLLIMVNAVRSLLHPASNSWVYGLALLIRRGRHPLSYGDPALRFAFVFLWAGAAIVMFLCLRMLARFSITDLFLRTFGGIVAVAGFPIACGYVSFLGYLRMLASFPRALLYAYVPHRWLAVEVLAGMACVFLYAFWKWPAPAKAQWGLLLLGLHFAIWTWFVMLGAGSGHILLWPGYDWTSLTREQPSLIYLLFGLLASLAWGLYVRQSRERPQSLELDPAPSQ